MIQINARYEHLRGFVEQLPQGERSDGQLLYAGRNEVRLYDVGGLQVVVKRFKRHGWVKAFIYTLLRPNKALRAYDNARQLRQRGFATPEEIGYAEQRRWGLIRQVWYVSAYTAAQPIRPRLIEQDPYDQPLATAYAHFVAALHERGVLHRDLNPTNVLFTQHDGQYHFELIDINRMRFYDGAVPRRECMENLTLFYWLTPAYRYILDVYAARRGWTAADIAEAISVKQRHDRRWVRRKRLTHPFSYKK